MAQCEKPHYDKQLGAREMQNTIVATYGTDHNASIVMYAPCSFVNTHVQAEQRIVSAHSMCAKGLLECKVHSPAYFDIHCTQVHNCVYSICYFRYIVMCVTQRICSPHTPCVLKAT